jgi:hypothetical protein
MRGNRQGVHASRKLFRQDLVNHPVPFDPQLPCEGRCSNMDAEMRFSLRSAPRVARMLAALVDDLKLARGEFSLQLLANTPTSLAKLHFATHGFVNLLKAHYLNVEAHPYCGICIARS